MIPVSDAYKAAIKASYRHITPKVKIYFDGDGQTPATFLRQDLSQVALLDEAGADSGTPLVLVSANQLTLVLNNAGRPFTPQNSSSPYYGKLKPNTLVKAYLSVQLADSSFMDVTLGVFRTCDWSSPSANLEATVICNDPLTNIGTQKVPMLRVIYDTTIYNLFDLLFQAMGLQPGVDYLIDPNLTQPVAVGWIPDDTQSSIGSSAGGGAGSISSNSQTPIRDALQSLAIAGCCFVTCDRYGRIRVRSNFTTGEPVSTFDESSMVNVADNPQQYTQIYSKVTVNYKLPYTQNGQNLLQADNLQIPPGTTTFERIQFSSVPVATVDQVILVGAVKSYITGIQYGASSMTITVNNPGNQVETVSIQATGKAIGFSTTSISILDQDAFDLIGNKELVIDNPLIQSQAVAKDYATVLSQYCKDPTVKFSVDIRGDPSIEVGDILTLSDNIDKIGIVNIMPIRFDLTYDGGLSGHMDARKPIIPYDWTFISPGLAVWEPRGQLPLPW